ncbi:MAG: class I SAM-dependent methyltransferase [Crocinitomicaceae bacterium]|nr:class I SAM-dependent methyltransferase [Crocinitomicaceae bacterium]
MTRFNRKKHWENIYNTKSLNEVSWYQPKPETSLSFIESAQIPTDAKVIDIGGGDSFLVDNLINLGYTNVSVVDISGKAIERARERLGEKANLVTWIESDINDFTPTDKYDFWHDRAAFHFLTDQCEIDRYSALVANSLFNSGHAVIGTFSKTGPLKCSGIGITQYSIEELSSQFGLLSPIDQLEIQHRTPFDTTQDFIFCHFKKP